MKRHEISLASLALIGMVVAGCQKGAPTDSSSASSPPTTDGSKYLLDSAPDGAQDVMPMREAVEDEQEVVVIGRIGGSHDPWVDGLAAFSIVDRSLAACTDIPGDRCPTPWDYCCVTDRLPGATTLVKVVDADGQLISTGAQELLGLSELQTVVVKGTAKKDEAGNVTVLAHGIYVDPANPGQVLRGGSNHDHDHGHKHEHAHDHHDHGDEKDTGHDHDKPQSDGQGGT